MINARPVPFPPIAVERGRRSPQDIWLRFAFIVPVINATSGVLGPLEARAHLGGAKTWGVLIAGQSLGTIAGAGIAGRIRPHRPILVATLLTFALPTPMLTLGLGAPAWLTFAAMVLCGIASDILAVLWVTTMQREIPEHVISRVSSYDLLASLFLRPPRPPGRGPRRSSHRPPHCSPGLRSTRHPRHLRGPHLPRHPPAHRANEQAPFCEATKVPARVTAAPRPPHHALRTGAGVRAPTE